MNSKITDITEFKKSLNESKPPKDCSASLIALWWDAKGNWEEAHKIAQDVSGVQGAWVHAYLHRKEGDEWNAGYWYNCANKPLCKLSLEAEWEEIAEELIKD